MLSIIVGLKRRPALEIVWRNPNLARRLRRRQNLESADERSVYIMQEYVRYGDLGFWTTLSSLEVVAGGRRAA